MWKRGCSWRKNTQKNGPPQYNIAKKAGELCANYLESVFRSGSVSTIIRFEPGPEDIRYLRTFKFENLTFLGTIEYRSICCQPIKDAMTAAAFHLGLRNRLHELYALLKSDHVIYHHGYTAGELRKMFVRKKLPSFVNKKDLFLLVEKVLCLGEEGLRERGLGEEVFLRPLFDRMERRTNPAKEMLDLREQSVPLEDIILSYGQLN